MNLFEDHSSHYEVLELTPDATPQEIRSAYLRLKSAYSKDNVAHYTLFSRDETESMIQKIESAYLILSNPEKRRTYDQAQGLSVAGVSTGGDIQSDFTPNDFASSGYGLNAGESSFEARSPFQSAAPINQTFAISALAPHAASVSTSSGHALVDLEAMIQIETEWSGAFIRKVREAKHMTLEDLSDYTRISRIYLNAIEEENYKKLPAAVYVRGFLQQIAKRLKIPVDQFVQKYLERYKSATPS